MNTDALIRTLTRDQRRTPPLETLLPAAVAVAALGVGAAFLAALGVRPTLEAAVARPAVLVKFLFPLLLALGALPVVLWLARPEARPGPRLWLLTAGPALALAAVIAEALSLPPRDWGAVVFAPDWWMCLTVIPVMSLPILGASLWALRRGASTRPGLSGAVAGLLSAGTAAAIYALYCTQDSPLFYGLWYGIGIAAITALGAGLGARLLRW